jgi:multidrug efflux pump subunit AcrA (membrane-fusion protein)
MKKTVLITAIIVILTTTGLLAFVSLTSNKISDSTFADAKKGTFEIVVTTTGELNAENSIDIKGPDIVQNRNFRSTGVKIIDIVPEGTVVKKGDYIATLDRTSFDNRLKDESDNLKNIQNDLQMILLDSAVTLTGLRDEIRNQLYAVEEAEITLEQAAYEPPAVQRKSKLALDKEKRFLEQTRKSYKLRYAQIISKIRNVQISFDRQERVVNDLRKVLAGFTITAPSPGMVIYKKDRMGNKITSGSTLDPWFPIVATLPDLSSMLSKIYVSEIEISKIKEGQPVQVTVDALQNKVFKGVVSEIANIGEALPNSDSKVFEVLVKLEEKDTQLRPSMTTGNRIITRTFDDVVYIPIESLQAGADSIPFVYTMDGKKQIVVPGESNDRNVIIEQGLTEGTFVWTINPENSAKYDLSGKELIAVNREKLKAKRVEMDKSAKEKDLLTEAKEDFRVLSESSGEGSPTVTSGGL